MALRFAVVSPRVRTSVYVIEEFPALGEQYSVQAIPATVVDDRLGLAGVVESAAELAEYLLEMQAHPDRARLRRPAVRPGTAQPWRAATPSGRDRGRAAWRATHRQRDYSAGLIGAGGIRAGS